MMNHRSQPTDNDTEQKAEKVHLSPCLSYSHQEPELSQQETNTEAQALAIKLYTGEVTLGTKTKNVDLK